MLSKLVKGIVLLAIISLVGYGAFVALREKPILVDLVDVASVPMKVTIDEEGVTQVKDVYNVSAPIAGHMARTELEEGDLVNKGQMIASIHPLEPPFLDDRTRAELQAAIEAARAGVLMAEVDHQRAQTALNLAQSEYERAQKLGITNIVSESQVERAQSEFQLQTAQLASAKANIELRQAELASAQAKLTQPNVSGASPTNGECCVAIVSPIDGVVLKVSAQSEQAVITGAQIAEIGDLGEIEIKVDLLSSDAVRIVPGASVAISDWGEEVELTAKVRRVEPAAFTKVSALGIEEQRVNVILDLEDPPQGLGHGYRVFARLTAWESDQTLQVPISALFRSAGSWAVFVAEADRAQLRVIEIGEMNATMAQVLDGLQQGDAVILFPSDQLEDGRKIQNRADAT